MSEKMVEIKYAGTLGTTAETPWGIKKAGDLFKVPERLAKAAVKTGNYAYKGEVLKTPDTSPTPTTEETILSAGSVNAAAIEPPKKSKK